MQVIPDPAFTRTCVRGACTLGLMGADARKQREWQQRYDADWVNVGEFQVLPGTDTKAEIAAIMQSLQPPRPLRDDEVRVDLMCTRDATLGARVRVSVRTTAAVPEPTERRLP